MSINDEEAMKAIDFLFARMKLSYQFFMHNRSEVEITDTKKTWFYHLQNFSPEQIKQGAEKMVDAHPKKAPELGEFKDLINTVQSKYRALPQLPPDMDERERARRATIIAYMSKVCSGMKLSDGTSIMPKAKILYTGNFPYQATADTVGIPKTSNLAEHKKFWNELYNNFAVVWDKFKRAD